MSAYRLPSWSRRRLLQAGSLLALQPLLPAGSLAAALANAPTAKPPLQPPAPAWMKDLILYEIATRGFTSPHGPQSGTFNSLRARLPYLHDLGISGIWLTGYSLCDAHHFYNIWTQYAVIDPAAFDPALGTAADFKGLIDAAHQLGIKVFLDVITHGLMQSSPVVRQHPEWFRGGSWGMIDFDWDGGHTDLDAWWVRLYSRFVTEYGVDGYRLDVAIYRPDLWERIRQNAAAAGHPIVIFEEPNSAIHGVTDFMQIDNALSVTTQPVAQSLNKLLADDLPGFYDRKFGRAGLYSVEVLYTDGISQKGSTAAPGELTVKLVGLTADHASRRTDEPAARPDGLPDVQLKLANMLAKPIANVTVTSDSGESWQLHPGQWTRALYIDNPALLDPFIPGPTVDVFLATLSWGSSVQLSCHDNGWTGFPLDQNPFVAQGSRALFGYSVLFTPMIPIFFSGEEFNATFHALPGLSPNLFGDRQAGQGRWLYGAQLDWAELDQPPHQAMFQDVRRMMAIRRQHAEVLAMCPGGTQPNLRRVEFTADTPVPVPYIRWGREYAILIAANRSRERDAALTLDIDLAATGLAGHARYTVTDLWSTAPLKSLTESELRSFSVTVSRDGIPQGGLAVFKIQPAP